MLTRITAKITEQEPFTLAEIAAMGIALAIGVTLAWKLAILWFGAIVYFGNMAKDWLS